MLCTRGYILSKLLKIKLDIWHNYQPIPSSIDLIRVISFYDNLHSRINSAWKSLIKSNTNPIFQTIPAISAFRKHKTIRNHLRYTNPNPDSWMPFSW